MTQDDFETEQYGFDEGNNPFMGEWRRTFNFPPVSYSNQSHAKKAFKEKIRAELNNNFVYSHQVTLTVILYLNEEKMLETPEYGDLDNYAKTICDAIKGVGGLIIDDCQIHRLDISWIDVPLESYFELELKSSPDDFIPSDCKLYEMNDGLYYPISHLTWSSGEIKEFDIINKYLTINAYSVMTRAKRKTRHRLREEGTPQFRTFQHVKKVSPITWGFHKTRVADSGFELVSRKNWMTEYDTWKANDARSINLEKYLEQYTKMIDALAAT